MAKILEDIAEIRKVAAGVKRVAVLGIKTDAKPAAPAYQIPKLLQSDGVSIVPVPVYFPEVQEILGETVYRTVNAIPGEVDMVDVFRRPFDIPQHLDDIIAKAPKYVWFQLGIRNDEAAQTLVDAGIDVVQDRCLWVERRAANPV